MTESMSNPEIFEKYGCVKVSEFLDASTLNTLSRYFQNKIVRGELVEKENDPTSRYAYYADPMVEIVLDASTKLVAETCGKDIAPTYSYFRIYQEGEELEPHVDRESCEISVTVNVANTGEKSGIWMHYKNNPPVEMILEPGEAVVYKGCESRHWRYPLKEGQQVVQFMLHYVDKNNCNAHYQFDGRPDLGYSEITRRL